MRNLCAIAAIPGMGAKVWLQMHERYVNFTKEKDPEIVFVGASIIHTIQCFPIWNDKFMPLKSMNLGVCGDRTQNVLWRVQNGLLDHIKPKICILNVGSINIVYKDIPAQIAYGIVAIIDEIRSKLPDCHIIVLGILPQGPFPGPLRKLGDRVNKVLKCKLRNMPKVELYMAENFLLPNGNLSRDDASDFIHPSETGYRKIFNPLFERLDFLLSN